MMDGIIKADGTSRLMRATLPATYEEFKAQAAAGTLPLDILFNEAGWSQLPTFLNKANLLKDLTANLFGLGTDAVPDDAFGLLSRFQNGLGNEYVWAKKIVQAGYEKVETSVGVQLCTYANKTYTIQYSDGVDVDKDTGVVSLSQPVTAISYTYSTFASVAGDVIKGKYLICNCEDYISNHGEGGISFVPTDAEYRYSNDRAVQCSGISITSVYNVSIESFGYVNSSDPNAYPIDDGYTYTALGQLGAKVQIATGSYVGTGAVGPSAPNAITFDKEPFLVLLLGSINQAGTVSTLIASGADSVVAKFVPQFWGTEYKQGLGLGLNTNGTLWGKKSADGKTFYWYHGNPSGGAVSSDSPGNQANTSGLTYYYAAIF